MQPQHLARRLIHPTAAATRLRSCVPVGAGPLWPFTGRHEATTASLLIPWLAMAQAFETPPADRCAYLHHATLQTRWNDTDAYRHVNNADYYGYFDTVINALLIAEGGLDIHGGETIGLCAESHCKFLGPLWFPGSVEAYLRVGHLGNSSVRYELALFDGESGEPAAVGWFVHVFVDAKTRRPADISEQMRTLLQRLQPS